MVDSSNNQQYPSTISGGVNHGTLPNMTPKAHKVASMIAGPATLRKLLPAALCLITFATVMTMLLVYMDTTALRHQQFRINMTQDYDMFSVAQDNPQLIEYIQEVHMRGNGHLHAFTHVGPLPVTNYSVPAERIAYIVSKLLGNKKNGIFVESLSPQVSGGAEYLSEIHGWTGLLVEADPRRYFTLRKRHSHESKIKMVHACLSPTPYPKEVSLHKEEFNDGVKINSILDSDSDWFNSRVKCFPLFSLFLAINSTNIDLLSISSEGCGLQILNTIPFDRVKISVIDIHLSLMEDMDVSLNITKFLASKSYKLVNNFGRNFVYNLNRLKI